MKSYSVTLNTATVQELADIINNGKNTTHHRDEALEVLKERARREYSAFKQGR